MDRSLERPAAELECVASEAVASESESPLVKKRPKQALSQRTLREGSSPWRHTENSGDPMARHHAFENIETSAMPRG